MAIESMEMSLIGSLLLSPDKVLAVAEVVKPTDFQDFRAQLAFGTIMTEWQGKRQVDLVSIAAKQPQIAAFLAGATSMACSPAALSHAHEIADGARMRRIKTGLTAATMNVDADAMLAEIMGLYQHEMRAGKKSPAIHDVLKRVDGIVKSNRKKGAVGFSTGMDFLEQLYTRYIPGHIWTIGGFTSVGKTAFMVQQIANLLTSGENPLILVVSTEMTEEQVVSRIIANITGVHSYRILNGKYHDAEEEDMVEIAKSTLAGANLAIYDDIYRLEEIETAFRKADLQGGVDVGFVDYVQNCRWPEAKSQYQEQSEIAKRFQSLAKDVRATVVCLSQVSNDVGRGNTDQLELKGAGEWAAVSDLGIILTRHKTEKYRLKCEVKKNRHGALGVAEFEYVREYTSIVSK